MHNQQSKIITNDRCTGCNRCIAACVVPGANYAVYENGKNRIYVNAKLCIHCGKCLDACPQGARDYLDDTEQFLARLSAGRISIVAAPSIRANFPGWEYLLGTLRSMGAKYIFDASFGGDICTWAYIRHIQKTGTTGLISQPCPVIVNYAEKYKPSLLPSLAPIQSPAVCTGIYMRNYRGIDGELAYLSPCIAKSDEFDDPNSGGYFQYNVTFRKLALALEQRGIDYRAASFDHFDNDPHGLGAIYPMPGGLKTNVQRVIPDVWIHQVEGQPEVCSFLREYEQVPAASKPFLVDILSCEKGCNIGPGACLDRSQGLAASQVMYAEQKAAQPEQKGIFKRSHGGGKSLEEFDDELKLEDFYRKYTSKRIRQTVPSHYQIDNAYERLLKHSPESRRINCGCCGFSRCEEMALAVAMEINFQENCVEYHKALLARQLDELQELLSREASAHGNLDGNLRQMLSALSDNAKKAEATVMDSARINKEVETLRQLDKRLRDTTETLRARIAQYHSLGAELSGISTQTKLLSSNASVEASHARELGKGFAVVAGEMQHLSELSSATAREMSAGSNALFSILEEASTFSSALEESIGKIAGSSRSILESIRQINRAEQAVFKEATLMLREPSTL